MVDCFVPDVVGTLVDAIRTVCVPFEDLNVCDVVWVSDVSNSGRGDGGLLEVNRLEVKTILCVENSRLVAYRSILVDGLVINEALLVTISGVIVTSRLDAKDEASSIEGVV